MLNLQSFTFNPFSENTYLLTNENKDCWIIDPGMYSAEETASFLKFLKDQQLKPQGIINTHTHIDHVFGVSALVKEYGLSFGIHKEEEPVLSNAKGAAMLFGLTLSETPKASHYIPEGMPLLLGQDELEVRLTPGHSPGSISFYYAPGKWVISGDALFAGSIGRTDLPGGNHQQLLDAIKTQLFTLPEETTVYSGHGGATNIGVEVRTNPFLR